MKLYKTLLGTLFIGVAMSSCLDLDPKDQLADGNLWNNASDFKYFANNFYGWTRDFGSSVFDAPHSDCRSDLMTFSSVNEYSHGSNSVQPTDGNYTGAYSKIRRTNLLIQNAESYTGKESIENYIAEAKFFRAYIYFDLVQLYGNAIITKKPLDINSPEMKAQRNDRAEVIDLVIEDLKDAAEGLPESIPSTENGRISKWGAYSFLSRVALYEGTWQKFRGNDQRASELLDISADAALKVIKSNSFELFKPTSLGEYAYKYMFILEDVKSNPAGINKSANKEYIFYRRHDEELSPIGKNVTHTCLNNTQYISRKFVNMYLCEDGLPIEKSPKFKGYSTMKSEFESRDVRMKNTLLCHGQTFWDNESTSCRIDWNGLDGEDKDNARYCDVRSGTGYQNQKWGSERNVQDNFESYDYPIIRYAEVLLNYAEAIYERDGNISDEDLDISLNKVRRRVNPDMPSLSNSFVSANQLNMRDEIRRERTVELFNEGFRIDDLKRWKTAESEMPMDMQGVKYTGTEFQSQWGTASSISVDSEGCLILENGRIWADRNYLYPLPVDQLQLNQNLQQNPGW